MKKKEEKSEEGIVRFLDAATVSGVYSVKTGYAVLIQQLPAQTADPFWKTLWSLPLQPKWKLFLWKLLHNGLAIKSELHRQGVPIQDVSCDLCGAQTEDFNHLFRECRIARAAWRGGCLNIHSQLHGYHSISDWIQYYIRLLISQDGISSSNISTFVGTLWALWLFRNNRVFNPDTPVIQPVGLYIFSILQTHIVFMDTDTTTTISPSSTIQEGLPPPGFHVAHLGISRTGTLFVQLQIDGAWYKDTRHAGIGWCVDNANPLDDRIIGGSNFGLCTSALHSEALAFLYALQWASDCHIHSARLFSDSYNLVTLLRGDGRGDIGILWLVQQIQCLGSTFQHCEIYKADRNRVHRAHQIAGEAAVLFIRFNSTML
ncbi:uncharacterized protein LOC110689524 [Chenopodium quinoa]|uniref:uncharacterized protein LOC110689524 n=1 Tax=Chenopodium quinoa TaxID=63459 RepID=UPI000B76CF0E|nr:uncharacterized protein LOC110689524 [Chenopodium quinoa]